MREIEIKARCSDVNQVLQRLKEADVSVSDPLTQHDEVFGLPGEKGDNINSAPWLRIRTEISSAGKKTILTLKKTVTSQLDSIEHETEIENAREAERIILQLGFEPYVKVNKVRRTAHIGDIELCIDEVKGLGCFVEAEKLTDDTVNINEITNSLWDVFDQFGIDRKDQVSDGYDVLIRHKENA